MAAVRGSSARRRAGVAAWTSWCRALLEAGRAQLREVLEASI
jgi:hypothetical protein